MDTIKKNPTKNPNRDHIFISRNPCAKCISISMFPPQFTSKYHVLGYYKNERCDRENNVHLQLQCQHLLRPCFSSL